MRNPVIIPNSREMYDVKKSSIREEFKMSLLSMCMNIGSLDININIKRDEEKKRKLMKKNAEHNIRLDEINEDKNNIESNYNLINYLG